MSLNLISMPTMPKTEKVIRQYIFENRSSIQPETVLFYAEVASMVNYDCRKPAAKRRTMKEITATVFEMINETEKFAKRIGAAEFSYENGVS